jgi:hypothetical protein
MSRILALHLSKAVGSAVSQLDSVPIRMNALILTVWFRDIASFDVIRIECVCVEQ